MAGTSNRWLGILPTVVAVIAAMVFGVPVYGQHVTVGGGGHVSAPAPRPPSMPHASAPRTVQPPSNRSFGQPNGGQINGGHALGGQVNEGQANAARPPNAQVNQGQVNVARPPNAQVNQGQVNVAHPPNAQGNEGQISNGRSAGGQVNEGQVSNGRSAGGQVNGGQLGVQGQGGGTSGGGQGPGGATAPRPSSVPHPPTTRRWPLPQGAAESDRPPPGQCRVWLNGVPGSRQPAPTSCGQAAKMRTPGSTLIFGDDGPPSGPQARPQ
jgi:hypothetical protein